MQESNGQDSIWRSLVLAGASAGVIVVSSLGGAAVAQAATAATDEVVAVAVVEEKEDTGPNKGRLSLTLNNDFTTAYMFRGILQERNGFIWQPSLELSLNLYSGDGALSTVDFGVGIWGSYQSEKTLNDGAGAEALYEVDYYPSLTLGWSNGLETSLTYYFYTSPNGAFSTVQQIDLGLAYDDSEVLGDFAVQPYATFSFETERTSFGTSKRGGYFEIGGEPSHDFILPMDEAEKYPITVGLPFALGLSLYDYYNDGVSNETFGYASIGAGVSFPLACIPEDFGSWTVNNGINVLFLDDALDTANRGHGVQAVWTSGISMDY